LDARTASAAAQTIREAIQAVISTVSVAVALNFPSKVPRFWELRPSENPLRLGPEFRLELFVRYGAVPVNGGWQARTAADSYRLIDADDLELLALQWEPTGESSVVVPHLHVGRSLAHPALPLALRRRVGRLAKAHVPTGFVPATGMLRMVVEDLGVVPTRPDWAARLDEAEAVLLSSFPET